MRPAMRRALLVLFLPLPALAEIYAWKEGGTTRLSSAPPPWYRADERVHGPRVVVTQEKRIVDDTHLPMVERWRLRPQWDQGPIISRRSATR